MLMWLAMHGGSLFGLGGGGRICVDVVGQTRIEMQDSLVVSSK